MCFLNNLYFYKILMKHFSVFRPSLLGPTPTLWHRIYTKLGAFQIITLLYVENYKNASKVGHSSKVARHGITSMYPNKFCEDSMRSVNPL